MQDEGKSKKPEQPKPDGVKLIRNRFSGARAPARLPVRVRTQTG
jgi:hypothetical protein